MEGHCATRVEVLHFKNPLLKEVPVSYVITMFGSKRRRRLEHELGVHRPTATVVIVSFTGLACRRPGITTVAQDILENNCTIARMSQPNDLVLILEDDVQFTPAFTVSAPSIDRFVKEHRRETMAYNLGPMPLLTMPSFKDHTRLLLGGFSQAVIYSRGGLDALCRLRPLPTWCYHDIMSSMQIKTYTSTEVCAIQPYEVTTNSMSWDQLGLIQGMWRVCGGDALVMYTIHNLVGRVGGYIPALVVLVVCGLLLFRASRSIVTGASKTVKKM